MEAKYTLICEGCGDAFQSDDAFPNPQLCPRCLPIFERGRFQMENTPKPVDTELLKEGYREMARKAKNEPKPDESRLLGTSEIIEAAKPFHGNLNQPKTGFDRDEAVAKAQDAKSSSILKAQEQAKMERIFREIEEHSACERLPFRDGKPIIRTIPEDAYQTIKKRGMK